MVNARRSTPVLTAIAGLLLISVGTGIYSLDLVSTPVASPERTSFLVPVAFAYLVALVVGIFLVGAGAWRFINSRADVIRSEGLSPLSPGWIFPYLMTIKKFRAYFWTSAIIYGIFYSVFTGMIVYQPGVNFIQAYGATIPSLSVTPLQGSPLFTPVATLYLTDHLGGLFVPLTILLVFAIPALVAVNFTLAAFAIQSRAGKGKGWMGGVGAVVGLFTGCPTCAALFFANALGGSGAVSFATLLGYYQPAFILLSIPVLVATPYLTSASLAKVYRDGCVVLAGAQG